MNKIFHSECLHQSIILWKRGKQLVFLSWKTIHFIISPLNYAVLQFFRFRFMALATRNILNNLGYKITETFALAYLHWFPHIFLSLHPLSQQCYQYPADLLTAENFRYILFSFSSLRLHCNYNTLASNFSLFLVH